MENNGAVGGAIPKTKVNDMDPDQTHRLLDMLARAEQVINQQASVSAALEEKLQETTAALELMRLGNQKTENRVTADPGFPVFKKEHIDSHKRTCSNPQNLNFTGEPKN